MNTIDFIYGFLCGVIVLICIFLLVTSQYVSDYDRYKTTLQICNTENIRTKENREQNRELIFYCIRGIDK